MHIEINEEPMTALDEYARVAIAFEVHRVLELEGQDNSPENVVLRERTLGTPYMKDFDSIT